MEASPGIAADARPGALPLDAHLHSSLSPDSDVPIDVYAADAYRRGIAEIAITDHLDFDPDAPAYAYADYARRERTVREAAERWAGRVAIRFGIELTYERRFDAAIREHLERHRYDYTIGSIHAGRRSPYTPPNVASFVRGRRLAEVAAPYFAEVESAVRSGLFDTIGHLDYIKKYVVDWFPPRDFESQAELYEPILAALVEHGVALEVNASGLRHRTGETYPAAWAVARFRELGGRRVTVGSDAHAPSHFAFGLEEACEIAARASFRGLSFRRGPGGSVEIALPERIVAAAAADT